MTSAAGAPQLQSGIFNPVSAILVANKGFPPSDSKLLRGPDACPETPNRHAWQSPLGKHTLQGLPCKLRGATLALAAAVHQFAVQLIGQWRSYFAHPLSLRMWLLKCFLTVSACLVSA